MRLQAQAEVRKALHALGLDHGTNQALFCRGAEAVRVGGGPILLSLLAPAAACLRQETWRDLVWGQFVWGPLRRREGQGARGATKLVKETTYIAAFSAGSAGYLL